MVMVESLYKFRRSVVNALQWKETAQTGFGRGGQQGIELVGISHVWYGYVYQSTENAARSR